VSYLSWQVLPAMPNEALWSWPDTGLKVTHILEQRGPCCRRSGQVRCKGRWLVTKGLSQGRYDWCEGHGECSSEAGQVVQTAYTLQPNPAPQNEPTVIFVPVRSFRIKRALAPYCLLSCSMRDQTFSDKSRQLSRLTACLRRLASPGVTSRRRFRSRVQSKSLQISWTKYKKILQTRPCGLYVWKQRWMKSLCQVP